MTDLAHSFSLPVWMWIGFGMFLSGMLFHERFRSEVDKLLAKMMDMRPRK